MCHKLSSLEFMGSNFADGHYLPKIPETSCSMRSESEQARASATRETAEASLTIPLPCLMPRWVLCNKRTSALLRLLQIKTTSSLASNGANYWMHN